MRCFNVLAHGRLSWPEDIGSSGEPKEGRALGFYCHRHILASTPDAAERKAMQRVHENLEPGWVKRGARVELSVEEVSVAPLFKGFLPDNRGHTFYS
jgi:hypothetical protein